MPDPAVVAALDLLRDRHPARVVDIGAGRTSRVVPDGCFLVGVDPSAGELALNLSLDAPVVASADDDLRSRLDGDFDAAVFWDVLEHVPHPWRALDAAAGVLNPGGLIVVAAPSLWSLKGLVTRLTPFRFHRWALRVFLSAHGDPFPTFLRASMTAAGLRAWARSRGFEVVFYAEQPEATVQRNVRARLRLTGWRWRLVQAVWHTAGVTDYRMILRRNG